MMTKNSNARRVPRSSMRLVFDSLRQALTILLLTASTRAIAQGGTNPVLIIERIAAEAAINRAMGNTPPNFRIVIDPMIVFANEAPGGRDSALRGATRNAYLTRAFDATTLPRKSVIDCSARPCVLRNADVYVTLSQPAIAGDNAKVTITTVQKSPRGIQYQTVNVVLRRQGSGWKVLRFEDLGIS